VKPPCLPGWAGDLNGRYRGVRRSWCRLVPHWPDLKRPHLLTTTHLRFVKETATNCLESFPGYRRLTSLPMTPLQRQCRKAVVGPSGWLSHSGVSGATYFRPVGKREHACSSELTRSLTLFQRHAFPVDCGPGGQGVGSASTSTRTFIALPVPDDAKKKRYRRFQTPALFVAS